MKLTNIDPTPIYLGPVTELKKTGLLIPGAVDDGALERGINLQVAVDSPYLARGRKQRSNEVSDKCKVTNITGIPPGAEWIFPRDDVNSTGGSIEQWAALAKEIVYKNWRTDVKVGTGITHSILTPGKDGKNLAERIIDGTSPLDLLITSNTIPQINTPTKPGKVEVVDARPLVAKYIHQSMINTVRGEEIFVAPHKFYSIPKSSNGNGTKR